MGDYHSDYEKIGRERLDAAHGGVEAARTAAARGDREGVRAGLDAFWAAIGRDYQELDSSDDAAHVCRVLDGAASDLEELPAELEEWGVGTIEEWMHAKLEELEDDLARARSEAE